MNNTHPIRPLNVLIAALGGEGGGVLMNWIVNAAISSGLPVQATSIPGVAQRTGATTYYIEIWPKKLAANTNAKPIFSLSPAVGEIDIMVATELAEAARALSNGFITPDRTTLISSNHRVYLTLEKMAMGDGRLDDKKLYSALKKNAKHTVMFDASELAIQHGTIINAVLLGALAGSNILPIELETFTSGIENEGKAVQANLAGFRAGFEKSKSENIEIEKSNDQHSPIGYVSDKLENIIEEKFPIESHQILTLGIHRMIDYQNTAYAMKYLERLKTFSRIDSRLCWEVGRHLAIRMTYQDIIRVAQAKIRENRLIRIRAEIDIKESEPFHITEFFKPGISEVADIMPPRLGHFLMTWATNSGHIEKLQWGMHVRSTTILGFLKLWFLAKLRVWRPRTYRWAVEQTEIDKWLTIVKNAAEKNLELAMEIAELAQLIKGYGSTHKRGISNYLLIIERFVRPILEQTMISTSDVRLVQKAREAALADPNAEILKELIASSVIQKADLAAE